MSTSEGGEEAESDAGREQRLWGRFGVTHNSELCKDLDLSCMAGAGTRARRIPYITELALKHSPYPATVLSNNLGKVQNRPHEMEKYV